MYSPRHFAVEDLSLLDALFKRDAFVSLITIDAEGLPFASHVPVIYRRDGERISIRGHWSRANPQAHAAGPALIIVHGPHGYVSPRWYTDPDQQVPTWNYAVAHLRGNLQSFDDAERLQSLVAELADAYEVPLGGDWRFPESAPGRIDSLRGIIGFELQPSAIALKAKFNQNHPEANRRGVIQALRQGDGHEQELADWMQRINFGNAE
ncbi:FMN-binding negative transcriptional regulator [Pseudomarimonas arenosa]|uniref:FMN-binding negative transcriptional regulator n=1 Tax=Pseudomarimonas arenosa TaxID=2774145 RepID=A0AAW3ZR31_9GAMM|nr:FMN-binding negative transcriptional regulator [Pseudomarimonas arenosa]MBD8527537.1 FMN-binding negative transcriptional regulator [Pseudomarimonas arenosa]